MLTHIFNTAKRILSRSPSAQEPSSETTETPPTTDGHSHGIEVTMVTTRRGTETPGQEVTPRSSAKRKVGKRELEALDTPTAVKRQRKSPPKKKEVPQPATTEEDATQDSTEDTSNTVAETVPASEDHGNEGKLPIRRRSSPKVVVAKLSPPMSIETEGGEEAVEDDVPTSTQESVYETPEQHSGSVYATPATRKKTEGSPTPRDRRHNDRASAKKSSEHKENMTMQPEDNSAEITPRQSSFPDEIPSSTYGSEQAPISSQNALLIPTPPDKAHVRFGSEEPTTTQESVTTNLQGHKHYEAPLKQKATQEAAMQEEDYDDDASDSDEAPEVISTTAAVSKAKASEQEARRALEAQQLKERTKRMERESHIAQQQAAKREREELKAKKLAKKLAKQQSAEQPIVEPEPRTAINRNKLPALLPTSLLSTLPDRRAPTPPPERRGKTEEELRKEKLNHHIKFLERSEKGPKDLKKGKLSVAVLGQQNRVLPPKANRDTRNVREKWLKGRQVETRKAKGGKGIGGKMERRAFGSRGFLRGED